VIVYSLGLITAIFPRLHIFYGQPTLTSLCALLLIILFFDKGNFKKYGFNKVKIKWLIYSVLTTFVYVLLFSFLQFKYFHVSNNGVSNNNAPIYLILLSALIGAPFYEELLSRGYLQSNLAHLKKYGFSVFKIYLSLPVFISALFFALGHLAIFNGMNMMFVLNTILYAFVLGMISGYFREKSDSIYPSFVIHSFANFASSLMPFVFIQLNAFNI